jgi:hypothetical protein
MPTSSSGIARNSVRIGRRGSRMRRSAGDGATAEGAARAASTNASAARSAGASAAAIPKSASNRRESCGCECRITTRTCGDSPRISSAVSRLSTSLALVSTTTWARAMPASRRADGVRKSPVTIRAPAAVARSIRSRLVLSSETTVTVQPQPRSASTTWRPNRPSPHTTTSRMAGSIRGPRVTDHPRRCRWACYLCFEARRASGGNPPRLT